MQSSMADLIFNSKNCIAMLDDFIETIRLQRHTNKKPLPRKRLLIKEYLFNQLEFADDMARSAKFINTPQYITNIHINGAVQVFVKREFVTEGFIVSIKSEPDQFAIAV